MRATCLDCKFRHEMRSPTDWRECRCRRIPTNDPNVEAVERFRLDTQNGRILARLQRGPATNNELLQIANKYTSRISDIRAAGYNVVCFDEDKKTGVTWYRLEV